MVTAGVLFKNSPVAPRIFIMGPNIFVIGTETLACQHFCRPLVTPAHFVWASVGIKRVLFSKSAAGKMHVKLICAVAFLYRHTGAACCSTS